MEKLFLKIPSVIAIDGPAASGKSSVGLKVAQKLDYLFLDTGIMYRAVAWAVLNQNIDIFDEEKIGKLAQQIKIAINPPTKDDGRINDIYVDQVDVTWKIREIEVNKVVSQISEYRQVRNALTEYQREFGNQGKIVMVGRDIGTIVMPNADLKIFLEASSRERAVRRYNEEVQRGKKINLEEIIKNIEMRDKIDSNRKIAPLVPAKDAVVILTDGKDVSSVVNEIICIVNC